MKIQNISVNNDIVKTAVKAVRARTGKSQEALAAYLTSKSSKFTYSRSWIASFEIGKEANIERLEDIAAILDIGIGVNVYGLAQFGVPRRSAKHSVKTVAKAGYKTVAKITRPVKKVKVSYEYTLDKK